MASGRNDGAAALLVMSEEKATELGLQPIVRVIAQAASGCDPLYMGMGPVLATQKALKQVGLTVNDLDVIELNEAFAAESIGCIRGAWFRRSESESERWCHCTWASDRRNGCYFNRQNVFMN